MPTALENSFALKHIDELEAAPRIAPGATDDGRRRFDVRRELGITAFGVQAFSAPEGGRVIGEHDENMLGEGGQEELYIVLQGAATFEIDGEAVEAPAGTLVQVQPSARRKATATEDGTTILVVGGTAGEAYKPAPEEAAQAFAAYGAGDFEKAFAKQREASEQQPDNPVVHFNAACFAARAGRIDDAIESLQRAVELNGGVRRLMAGDEDLDSIRDDPRFAELSKSDESG